MITTAKPVIGKEEKEAVLEVLNSGMLAQGTKVKQFEKEFAEYIGTAHAIATSNGTTALHTALAAHGINQSDEVITTPFTFIATANAIKMVGAKPVFVDIDETSFNIDHRLIEEKVTSKTKAILVVHLYGRPANMIEIQKIADKHNLIIIEDCAQAAGASYQKIKVGSKNTGCFSFYPTKNMTTGEGGMVTTNDKEIEEKARKLIEHGSAKKYVHEFLGYNYRMTDIEAAIGIEQLKKLDTFNQARRNNALHFNQKLKNFILPEITEGHVFHQYIVRVNPKKRKELMRFLLGKGILSAIHYPLPIHKQEAYKEYNQESFPIAEKLAKEVLSLPVHPSLSKEELDKIIEALE